MWALPMQLQMMESSDTTATAPPTIMSQVEVQLHTCTARVSENRPPLSTKRDAALALAGAVGPQPAACSPTARTRNPAAVAGAWFSEPGWHAT